MIIADDTVAKSGDYKKAVDQLAGAKGYYEGHPGDRLSGRLRRKYSSCRIGDLLPKNDLMR